MIIDSFNVPNCRLTFPWMASGQPSTHTVFCNNKLNNVNKKKRWQKMKKMEKKGKMEIIERKLWECKSVFTAPIFYSDSTASFELKVNKPFKYYPFKKKTTLPLSIMLLSFRRAAMTGTMSRVCFIVKKKNRIYVPSIFPNPIQKVLSECLTQQ